MHRDRRRFFGWLGGASLAGAAAIPASSRPLLAAEPTEHPKPITDKWDVSWADRVEGAKYRAVFDSPQMSDGAALFRAVAWVDHYKEVYGIDRTDMAPVVVFRHQGISLIMNDAYWTRFEIGKENKMRDEKGKKWQKVNPVSAQSAGSEERARKYKLETFLGNGGTVLACGWAFGGVIYRFKEAEKLEQKDAEARAKEHLISGVLIQPNGIFACLRAQEAGCQYIMGS